MKKNVIKIFCATLAVTCIVSFSSISAFATENNASEAEMGFVPSADSTWGDLYRHFDYEGFSALSPEEKQFYDSVLLNSGTESTVLADTRVAPASTSAVDDVIASYMEEHGKEDYVSVYTALQPEEPQSRAIELGIAGFSLGVTTTTNSIEYTGLIATTVACPKLGIAVTLYDENGIYTDFNSESESNATFCGIDDTFENLQSKKTYTVHALGLVTPPANYVLSNPLAIMKDYTTK